jgi:hypothetical protein
MAPVHLEEGDELAVGIGNGDRGGFLVRFRFAAHDLDHLLRIGMR